jgi:hypothetical protein
VAVSVIEGPWERHPSMALVRPLPSRFVPRRNRIVGWSAAFLVSAAMWLAMVALGFALLDRAASTSSTATPTAGTVTVCVWAGMPNPVGLPICPR